MLSMSGNSEWGRVLLALLVNISRDVGAGDTKQVILSLKHIYIRSLDSRLKSIEQYKSSAVNNKVVRGIPPKDRPSSGTQTSRGSNSNT